MNRYMVPSLGPNTPVADRTGKRIGSVTETGDIWTGACSTCWKPTPTSTMRSDAALQNHHAEHHAGRKP